MHKPRELLLVATLAGLLIVGVAAFAVQPGLMGAAATGSLRPAGSMVLNAADLPLGQST